jgi:TRAP-type C4-dicarboxylate transport system substrate-binding protein
MLGAAAALGAAMIGLAACQGMASLNKAGAVRQSVTVIRLQMPDDDEGYGTYFARAAGRYSHGTLKVVVDYSSYPSVLPANESRLVAAQRAGRVGFSFQPARDWAAARLPGFEALDAPFLVTTVRASDLLAASPVAAALLRELSSLGLVGLGMVPSEPRQILATRPLLAPAAFRGTRVRITDNPQTAALMTAIGSRPVQGLSANQVGGLLRSGSLTGVEGGAYYMLANSYNAEAPYLTSYALFPKFDTLVATRRAWMALTTAQRAAVRQAIAATLAHARTVLPGNESRDLAELCTNGVVLDEPSSAQLAALAREAAEAPANVQVSATMRMIRAACWAPARSSAPSRCPRHAAPPRHQRRPSRCIASACPPAQANRAPRYRQEPTSPPTPSPTSGQAGSTARTGTSRSRSPGACTPTAPSNFLSGPPFPTRP